MSVIAQAYFEQLVRSQFLAPERMLAYQAGLTEQLVRHARAHVPFYRDSGRLDMLFTPNDEIDWSRWEEVPVLTRVEAQRNAEALYSEFIPEHCGPVINGYTTGSTGTPLRYRITADFAEIGTAMIERGYVWAGLPAGVSAAWFINDRHQECPYPDGKTFHNTIRGEKRLLHYLAVQTSIEDQGRWLARLRPDVVMGYPGATAELASRLPPELADHSFKLVVCVGEVTTEPIRAMIERGFKCPVMDFYSGSEFGPVAIEDHKARRLFICEESIFVEFRKRDDFAVTEDGLVELIFTPFYNYAMPLIRYATGDFAVVDRAPPSDLRTLRRLTRVAGRERNFFILPSGRLWWPTYQSGILGSLIDYKQMQFAQTAHNRIEIRFASDKPEPIKDPDKLDAYLRRVTPEPMEIVVRQVPGIAQRPSGKYEYATCEINQPTASA
jgi:phenylacetate-CoA ligase